MNAITAEELQKEVSSAVSGYKNGFEHIADELNKLDMLIRLRVSMFDAWMEATNHPGKAQQPYITREEVQWLTGLPKEQFDEILCEFENNNQELINAIKEKEHQINLSISQSIDNGVYLPLIHLANIFNLSEFELHVVIMCVAPELDTRYDRLYAYLQDDITRKKPSIDLALNLFFSHEYDKWMSRSLFNDENILFKADILKIYEDRQSPSGSSGLSSLLSVDDRILRFLLGNQSVDSRLSELVRLHHAISDDHQVLVQTPIREQMLNLIEYYVNNEVVDKRKKVVINLYGAYGAGKRTLALSVCQYLCMPMMIIDLGKIASINNDPLLLLQLAFREALLQQAVLYLKDIELLFGTGPNNNSSSFGKHVYQLIEDYGWLIFVGGSSPWNNSELMEDPVCVYKSFSIRIQDSHDRARAWKVFMQEKEIHATEDQFKALANQFRLSSGQIRDAVKMACINSISAGKNKNIDLNDLHYSSIAQSNHKLQQLAVKVTPNYIWDDIVLPPHILLLLKTICSHVKQTNKVFEDWGFDEKIAYGRGISALLSGAPGTGKTMAAQVIAAELGIDMYKIDLSNVVSKYIGETEKNLKHIFSEAENSDVVLMFDECDALFGKRTEVSDAHDRYANIEVSYLLQKMEEYDGIVILTTNFKKNIDEAFVRRIRFVVDFPFPDKTNRQEIWERQFPAKTPLDPNIDFELLAKKFNVSGGNIRNIALNAAFMAAEQNTQLSMAHLFDATSIEYEKIGKLGHGVDQLKREFELR